MRFISSVLVLSLFILSCSSPFLKNDEMEKLNIDEGLPDVKVKEIGGDPNVDKVEAGAVPASARVVPVSETTKVREKLESTSNSLTAKKEKLASRSSKKSKKAKGETEKRNIPPKGREPNYESDIGFAAGARRPDKDPFRVGEKVVLSVRYFKAEAGEMTMEVKPFVEVDGRRSYRWFTGLKTTGMFSKFYSIDDGAETLVDYETLFPSVFTLNVKESAQLRNGKGYFDSKTLKGVYVEKKFTEKKGHESKHQEWKIMPYAQNVFSAAFYMRVFSYEVGKEYKFIVADDEKNITFKGKALRKEKVQTDAGSFDTIVVKPEFEIAGVFKPVGDIFFWLTDDDRKMIVRIESEIKIGTLVMEAVSVDKGS